MRRFIVPLLVGVFVCVVGDVAGAALAVTGTFTGTSSFTFEGSGCEVHWVQEWDVAASSPLGSSTMSIDFCAVMFPDQDPETPEILSSSFTLTNSIGSLTGDVADYEFDAGGGPEYAFHTVLDVTGATGDLTGTSGTLELDGALTYLHSQPTTHSGTGDLSGSLAGTFDTTPPVVAMTAPAKRVRLSTTVGVAWSGEDESAIHHFDTRRRVTPWNQASGSWVNWLSSTQTTSANYAGSHGRTNCFAVRAQDGFGNVSGWSPARCTAVPLRSDQLTRTTGWSKQTNTGYFAGFAYRTTTHGAKMIRTGVVTRRLYLVATKCASCGTVQARWNGAVIANVNLANPTTLRRQVIFLRTFTSQKTGTLTLTVTSPTGIPVTIEGLAVYNAAS